MIILSAPQKAALQKLIDCHGKVTIARAHTPTSITAPTATALQRLGLGTREGNTFLIDPDLALRTLYPGNIDHPISDTQHPLTITVTPTLTLNAGTFQRTSAGYTLTTNPKPLINQIIDQIDLQPANISYPHHWHHAVEGVVLATLTTFWGTYLCTLNDPLTSPHPDIRNYYRPQDTRLLAASEFQRITAEAGYAFHQIMSYRSTRGEAAYRELIAKAYRDLPRFHSQVAKDRYQNVIFTALALTSHQPKPLSADPLQILSTALAYESTNRTLTPYINTSTPPGHPLRPHQIRFTKPDLQNIMYQTSAYFSTIAWNLTHLFDSSLTTYAQQFALHWQHKPIPSAINLP